MVLANKTAAVKPAMIQSSSVQERHLSLLNELSEHLSANSTSTAFYLIIESQFTLAPSSLNADDDRRTDKEADTSNDEPKQVVLNLTLTTSEHFSILSNHKTFAFQITQADCPATENKQELSNDELAMAFKSYLKALLLGQGQGRHPGLQACQNKLVLNNIINALSLESVPMSESLNATTIAKQCIYAARDSSARKACAAK